MKTELAPPMTVRLPDEKCLSHAELKELGRERALKDELDIPLKAERKKAQQLPTVHATMDAAYLDNLSRNVATIKLEAFRRDNPELAELIDLLPVVREVCADWEKRKQP
jgi:hypothetical protein